MRMPLPLRRTPLIVALMAAASLNAAQNPPTVTELPGAVWERPFHSSTVDYELNGVAPAGDALWLVVGVRPWGALGAAQRHELWRIDSRGERVNATDLTSIGRPGKPVDSDSTLVGLTALPDGHAAILFQGPDTLDCLVIDESGKVVSNRSITSAVPDAFITRVRASSDGNVLAVGRQGTQSALLKLRPSGQLITNLRVPGVSVLEDVFETADGYAALGSSLEGATGEVWVGKISVDGGIGAKAAFTGVNPSLSPNPRGLGYVLTYETNADKGRHVVVQGLTPAMSPAWTTTMPDMVPGLRPYAAEPIGDSDFLLVGAGARSVPLVQRLKANGQAVWRYEHREPQMTMTLLGSSGLNRWNGDYLVAFTLSVVEAKNGTYEQHQIVRLMRVRAN
jgi:hypothetical protein